MQNEPADLYHQFRVACAMARTLPGHQADRLGATLGEVRACIRARHRPGETDGLSLYRRLKEWVGDTHRAYWETHPLQVEQRVDDQLRQRFEAVRTRRGLSLRMAAENMGRSHSNLVEWRQDKYAGNVAALEHVIREWVEKEERT